MLLRVFLLSSLLLVFPMKAQSRDIASDVFFDFARSHQSTLEEIIGPNGRDQIIEHTKNWKVEDAHFLINSLTEAGLTPNDILKAIWITISFAFSTENHEEVGDASDAFFQFAIDNLTESDLEAVIGDGWLTDVIQHTQKWREEDAQNLTDLLTKAEIEPDDTLKIIRIVVGLLQKPAVVSETLPETEQITNEATKQANHVKQENAAATVFIDFVRMHRGDNFEREMGSQWVEDITESTQTWTANEATEFLNYLVDLISVDLTLARIKAASYFGYMHYKDFKERVDFYRREEYLGEDGIRKKLSQSFSGLHKGEIEDIENTIQQIQNIIGQEGIQKIFSKPKVNLAAFAIADTEITHIVNWLEDTDSGYGIPMAEIKEAIIRDPEAFTRGHLINLTSIAGEIRDRLNKYGLPGKATLTEAEVEAKINELIIRSPQAFTMSKVENLTAIAGEIKKRLNEHGLLEQTTTPTEAKINEAILKDPGAFTKGKVENLRAIIEEIRGRLKRYGLLEGKISDTAIEKRINEILLNNPGALTKGKVGNLRAITEEIKNQLTTGHEMSEELILAINKQINEVILSHPGDLTRGKVENLSAIIDKIKDRVEQYGLPEGINMTEVELEAKLNLAIIKYPRAFTVGTVANLRDIIKEVTGRVKKYGLLKEATPTEAELQKKFNIAIIRNPRAFTRGTADNLRAIVEEIKSQVKEQGLQGEKVSEEMMNKKINKAILKNIEAFTRGKVQNLKLIMKEIKERVEQYGLPEGIELSETTVLEMLTRNTAAFTRGNIKYLKTIANEIKNQLKTLGFTEAEIEMKINGALINHTEYFTRLTSRNLNFIEKYFGIKGLAESLRNSSTGPSEEIAADELDTMITLQNQQNIEDCPSQLSP